MWLTRPRRPASVIKPAAGRKVTAPEGPPPRLLGVWRALIGIILLALSWGGLVLVAMFGGMVWPLLVSRHITPRLGLYALGAIGICWIGIVSLCCLVTGAFCLSLAVSRASWE